MFVRFLILFSLLTSITLGRTALARDSLSPPPPLPDEPQKSTDIPEPQVNIIHREDRTIEEYRVNGALRYIKIIPSHGPAYYMIDTDGDGSLDKRYDDLENPPFNQWILLEW